ncbi:unnamed protein product [Chondrus crispus]|uniref:Uncharacterized protein n=1 Tax=Chondrus crispus TaxID=2769 RepID=R7Q980_CHOCR|nr:unnamed protein product [Chondrus crispus]CDF34010.1 unnamed protein product [Chondrus crispus]|eukprot:XP_005713829.1 unnamed protein product [Chondrus crispus]
MPARDLNDHRLSRLSCTTHQCQLCPFSVHRPPTILSCTSAHQTKDSLRKSCQNQKTGTLDPHRHSSWLGSLLTGHFVSNN